MIAKKTDRRYGEIYQRILERAKKGPFCVSELSGPEFGAVDVNCRHLRKAGKLKLVKTVTGYRNHERPVYRAA